MTSDSETGVREDLSGIDSHPVSVSSEHVERKERGDPFTKPTKNPKPNTNEDENERGDPYGTDHHPAIVSSESVERQERGDPYPFRNPEWLARIQRTSRG